MNSLLGAIEGAKKGNFSFIEFARIISQAVDAAKSGQDPHSFMEDLSKDHVELQGLDFKDLMGTAEQLARKKGTHLESAKKQLDDMISPLLPK